MTRKNILGRSVKNRYTEEELNLLTGDFFDARELHQQTKTVLPNNFNHKDKTRILAYNQLIQHYTACNFHYFVTATFNDTRSYDFVRTKLYKWHQFIDRIITGPRYAGKHESQRVFFISAVEHPNTNTHVHMMLRLPKVSKFKDFETNAPELWEDLVPAGDMVLSPVKTQLGKQKAIKYMAKDMWQEVSYENFIISSEFHSK